MALPEICADITKALEEGRHQDAQNLIREHLMDAGCIPQEFIWKVYRAFYAHGAAPEDRHKLPKDIANWIAWLALRRDSPNNRGVTFGDLAEMSGLNGDGWFWMDQFNPGVIAEKFRRELEVWLADPLKSGRMSEEYWNAVKAAWALMDAGNDGELRRLQEHFNMHDCDIEFNPDAHA